MHQEKQNKPQKILLAGGGTGGHVFPLVAVAEELAIQKRSFVFIGTSDSLEQRVVTGLGWEFVAILAGKWRRYSSIKSLSSNLIDFVKSIVGFFQAISIIRRHKISTVFSKGGYVALPVVLAAKLLGRRIVVHESDAVMGLSNRLSSKVANRVLTAFEVESYPNHTEKFLQVGIPVRSSLRRAATLKAPKKSRPLLFILPGSQGSVAVNNFVRSALTHLLSFADIVHLTGERDFKEFSDLRDSMSAARKSHYKPYVFIDRELPYYFQTADLLVARASATTIAESACFNRAMYLIPLPTAASNHQVENALRLDKTGAAIVRQENQLTGDKFVSDISALLTNQDKLDVLGKKLHDYFMSNDTIPKIIEVIDGKK